MRIALDEATPGQATVVALGTFDGLHLGHRLLLGRARALAKGEGLKSAALTFPKPPGSYKKLLLPPELKLRLLEEEVDLVVVADFPKLRWLRPEEFARLLSARLNPAYVVVGEDYRFGRDREGDVALLRELGEVHGFQVEALAKLSISGRVVSSTAVREAIQAGDISWARQLLGYPPLLFGPVVPGEGRGQKLGFPTANLKIPEELVTPPDGVYAVEVKLPGGLKPGLLYIGRRPTFDGKERSYEVYLLDFAGELYGEELEVHLRERLRGDLEFPDQEALKRQIEQDLQEAQRFFLARSTGG
ncbi:MAG: riboflavin biosynthesis protein RibF [Candidatus Bipolaricaulia bacterium]